MRAQWPKFKWEALKPSPVIGVDEVGRGCLAGPVYAAAVMMNPPAPKLFQDSKILSEKRREELSKTIKESFKCAVGIATVEEIATLNILWASMLAMRRAIEGLGVDSGHVIVDGKLKIPGLNERFIQTPVIKGDLRAEPISAASILAKVERDHLMYQMANQYGGYGFEKHKGYPTPIHKRALEKLGPTPIHRLGFRGVICAPKN